MNTEQKKSDLLESLFRNMPEEALPASFRIQVMQQVMKEAVKIKKRNERLGLLAVILASLAMITLAALAFLYMDLPRITMPKIDFSAFSFYLYIGILSLFLLFLDYKFRQAFRKDE